MFLLFLAEVSNNIVEQANVIDSSNVNAGMHSNEGQKKINLGILNQRLEKVNTFLLVILNKIN